MQFLEGWKAIEPVDQSADSRQPWEQQQSQQQEQSEDDDSDESDESFDSEDGDSDAAELAQAEAEMSETTEAGEADAHIFSSREIVANPAACDPEDEELRGLREGMEGRVVG